MLAHMLSQGAFETAPFAAGTYTICEAVARSDSIIGGASLEFMEGKQLPGIVALTGK